MMSIVPPWVKAMCLTRSTSVESMMMVWLQAPEGVTPVPGANTSTLTAPDWSVRTTCARMETAAPSTVAVAPLTSGMIRTVARPFSPPGMVPVRVQYGAAIYFPPTAARRNPAPNLLEYLYRGHRSHQLRIQQRPERPRQWHREPPPRRHPKSHPAQYQRRTV